MVNLYRCGGGKTKLDGTATESDVLSGKTFYNTTTKQAVTGTLPTQTQATPSISVSSGGLITASATQSEGYVVGGTKSATKQMTVKGATTITPSTSNQTIATGTYLTGVQTIKGDANLVAGNIASGKSIFGVNGTFQGTGTKIKRVYTQSFSNGASGTVNVPSGTNLNNCIFLYSFTSKPTRSGMTSNTGHYGVNFTVSGSTLTATFTKDSIYYCDYIVTVIEFDNVKKIQRGFVSGANTGNSDPVYKDITISSVTTSNAFVLFSVGGGTEYLSSNLNNFAPGCWLSSATNLKCAISSNGYIYWNVIEFN